MVKVKICGITDSEDAQVAVEAGADALGFVMYQKSPRYVRPDTARAIVATLPPFVVPIGVFVNEEPDLVRHLMDKCGFALVQLHGDESASYCETLGRPVIKAVRLKDRSSLPVVAEYYGRAGVRGFVIDAFSEQAYGGTGQTVDWILAAEIARTVPVVLAGGLRPDNVADAVRSVRPYGVDVSSGVEARPGKKDPAKVKSFVQAVKLVP
ncbi:MAG: phosphoribosylanthranilate isomerase [Nitrospira sp.]|nr:phosphoribosylanthranilate isomerase [Nitrospira sp.]MCP9441490.1 phosphoribosylanthranilate isomerase [Nitrospira sp.]